jgi:hypothetical protein
MPGARPSTFKQGGGFLNNVDGTITDYEFTTEFPGGDNNTKKHKDWADPMYVILSVRVDGADEDVTTTLKAGNADNFEITDNGKTLVPVEEGFALGANSGWGKFINSFVEAGERSGTFYESELSEDVINFEPIIGHRVRFAQRKNEWTTSEYGQRVNKKTGKKYDRQDLVVEAVYANAPGPSASVARRTAAQRAPGRPTQASAGARQTPSAQAATTTSPSKGRVASRPNGAEDVTGVADETLVTILKAQKSQTILKAKLPVQIAKTLGVKHPQREEVRRMLYSDEYLTGATERGLIVYDVADDTQTIELVQ